MKKIYLVIDTETTGSSPLSGDRILEIAAIPVYGNKILHNLSFQSLVNPLVKIPAQITGIHGLKNEDVSEEPTMAEVFPRFRDYVGGATLVGHNIVNDMTFFDIASKETGVLPLVNNYIDTIDIAHEVFFRRSIQPHQYCQEIEDKRCSYSQSYGRCEGNGEGLPCLG
jgi:DNA polymerase-3 subunit epsilon